MRTPSFARIVWSLLFFFFCCQTAIGQAAQVYWKIEGGKEHLSLQFDLRLPDAGPRMLGSKLVLIPVRWSFWQRERRPRPPDFSSSKLVQGVLRTQKGIEIHLRHEGIDFLSQTQAEKKAIVITLWDRERFTSKSSADLSLKSTQEAEEGSKPPLAQTASLAPQTEDWVLIPPVVRYSVHDPVPEKTPGVVAKKPVDTPSLSEESPEPEPLQALTVSADSSLSALSPGESEKNVSHIVRGTVRWPEENTNRSQTCTSAKNTENAPASESFFPPEADQQAIAAKDTPPEEIPMGTEQTSATLEQLENLQEQLDLVLEKKKYPEALSLMQEMLVLDDLPESEQERLLYLRADILMQQSKEDPVANFVRILNAYEQAKNWDPTSKNVPEALLGLAKAHLAVGNIDEAKGYFALLRRRYSGDPRLPFIDYTWATHFMERGDFRKAADHFRYVLRNFPDSAVEKAARLGLLRCFSILDYHDKALKIVDSIEKKWPEYFLTEPDFLLSAGEAAMLSGQLERAKEYFWTAYNVFPEVTQADVALARIGDILVKQGKTKAAREIYQRTAREFPNKEGGLIAQMRLAEEGMLAKPGELPTGAVNPQEVYERILRNTNSTLAPVAQLKLAMWHLWNERYAQALQEVESFQQKYSAHELQKQAAGVADKALGDWMRQHIRKKEPAEALALWEKFQRQIPQEQLSPGTRLVAAQSFLETETPRAAFALVEPLLQGEEPGPFAVQALDIGLAALMDAKDWEQLAEVIARARAWTLPREKRLQLNYALALAYENLDQPDKARPLWKALSVAMDLPEQQRAYALYFLARAALRDGDGEQTDILAQEALTLLRKEGTDTPKIKDCLDMLARAAELRGQNQEALAWSMQYGEYVNATDQDWPAFIYRKAVVLKKTGDITGWKKTLEKLVEKAPNTLYSRMAASELEGARLQKQADLFE